MMPMLRMRAKLSAVFVGSIDSFTFPSLVSLYCLIFSRIEALKTIFLTKRIIIKKNKTKICLKDIKEYLGNNYRNTFQNSNNNNNKHSNKYYTNLNSNNGSFSNEKNEKR